MGAVFAACSRAPITAVLIIFELTGDYRIVLPLMFAIVVATALANALTRDTIYTLKLRRRGIDIDAPAATLMAQISVAAAMGEPPRALRTEQPLHDVLERFAGERADELPVADGGGALLGVVTAADVEEAIAGSRAAPLAGALMRNAPELRVDQSLDDAVRALAGAGLESLPVLDANGEELVGWLTHRRLLRAYHQRLEERATGSADAPQAWS
jgi:CIC family chloride channel protein